MRFKYICALCIICFSTAAHGKLSHEEAQKECRALQANPPTSPTLIRSAPPAFPLSALKAHQEGWVLVSFTLNEKGKVKHPTLVDHGGDKAFIKPALKAMKKFRYEPIVKDGQAVSVSGMKYCFTFAISE